MKNVSWQFPLCGILVTAAACGGSPEALDIDPLEDLEPQTADQDDAASLATPAGYTITRVTGTGDAAPGGGEVNGPFYADEINKYGDVIYSTWLTTGGSGFFRTSDGAVELLARPGGDAPGGALFGSQHSWHSGGLNQSGGATFSFNVAGIPAGGPMGSNVGVFRSDEEGTQTAIVLPNTTVAPGGQPFRGALMRANMNKRASVAFTGMIETSEGIHLPGQPYAGLGLGVFVADRDDVIQSVVSPGDPAPGGGTFDIAQNGYINDRGDVAFGAHVAGEDCRDFGVSQSVRIFCAESLYLRRGSQTISIAHQDDPAPGGGTFRLAFGPVLNKHGDVLFIGDVTAAPGIFTDLGVFLHRGGQTVAVALPGDAMPGGGHLVAAPRYVTGYDLSDNGQAVFSARLDTDEDGDGAADTGVYAWKQGHLHLVARTGTQIAGLGTVRSVANSLGYGMASNNAGQVAIPVKLADGSSALVVATPE